MDQGKREVSRGVGVVRGGVGEVGKRCGWGHKKNQKKNIENHTQRSTHEGMRSPPLEKEKNPH